MTHVRRYTFAAVALAMLVGTWARAQVMQSVPSDALVVIKIKNLQDVSAKIANLSQQWGLANMRPELNDPLGTLLTVASLGPGIDKAGEAGVAILSAGPQAAEPDVLILIPVTDFKAFAASLPNGKTEAGATTFQMGDKPGFVGDWGKYAALSPKQALTAKKGAGIQAAGVAAKELDGKDLVAFANLKVIRKDLLPLFQQNKQEILKQAEQGMQQGPNANPKFVPLGRSVVTQMLNVVEEFLTDADAATLGINLSKDGIATTLLADFAPQSYIGKAVAGTKNTDASFTAGLPENKYFVYGGATVDKQGVQVLNDILAPIEAELAKLGPDVKPITDYIAAAKSYFGATTSQTFGMLAPPANALQQQQGLIQFVSVVRGDAQKLMASQRQMFATQQELMKAMGGPQANMVQSTIKENAKTVDGVAFDQLTTAFKGNPQTPEEQQVAMMFGMLYGPNGLNGYSGPVGNDKVLTVFGGADALLDTSIKAAKGNTDTLAQGVTAKVSANLPKNRVAAFYLPIDTIATTVLEVMAARGAPVGVKLPPNLPPLGATVATEASAIRVDGYIPAQTVQSLIAAGMQLYLQQMQGQGQGQPGGL